MTLPRSLHLELDQGSPPMNVDLIVNVCLNTLVGDSEQGACAIPALREMGWHGYVSPVGWYLPLSKTRTSLSLGRY